MLAKAMSPTGWKGENHMERHDEQSRKLVLSDGSNEVR
jgi:hypothetical protein